MMNWFDAELVNNVDKHDNKSKERKKTEMYNDLFDAEFVNNVDKQDKKVKKGIKWNV